MGSVAARVVWDGVWVGRGQNGRAARHLGAQAMAAMAGAAGLAARVVERPPLL